MSYSSTIYDSPDSVTVFRSLTSPLEFAISSNCRATLKVTSSSRASPLGLPVCTSLLQFDGKLDTNTHTTASINLRLLKLAEERQVRLFMMNWAPSCCTVVQYR